MMRMIVIRLAGVLMSFWLLCSSGGLLASGEFFVAPGGDDVNPGSREKPFATLERARDRIREMKRQGGLPAGGVTVWIDGPMIQREKPFTLAAEDSGDVNSPIVYRGLAGKEVCIQAARVLKPADVKPVSDAAVIRRLDPAARGKVVQINLAALGVQHIKTFPDVFSDGGGIVQLFCNGRRLPLSRWPNEGYVTMAEVLDKGDVSKGGARHGGSFVYREDRPARWNVEQGVWLDGFWRVPWEPSKLRVKSIDPAQRQITFAQPLGGGIGSKYAGPRGSGKEPWYALNLLEEIDMPGEWCIDFKSKMLYVWLPEPVGSAALAIADMDAPLVEMNDVSFVTFRGLVFEGGLNMGAQIKGGQHNLLAGCTFRRLGKYGAAIRGGQHNGAQSSDFYDLGHGGIILSGGDRKSLTAGDNFACNNHIHHFGVLKQTYAPGIAIGIYDGGDSVGNRVQHNLIHDAPHAAVLYGGNDNLLEYNEIHDVALDSGDVGAFYTWADWTSRGNMLRYNFVYQSPRCNAFYMDDGDSGDTIFGNVVRGCSYGPFIGGGHDNIIRNNIVIECERGLHIDARGVARGYNASNKRLMGLLNAVDYKNPPWSTKYPQLPGVLDRPELPTGCVIENNVTIACKTPLHVGAKKEELSTCTIRDNVEMTMEQAGFVDPQRQDLRLKSDSTIRGKLPQFEAIPFEKIGLCVDEYRAAVPPRGANVGPGKTGVFDSNTDVQRSNQKK